MDDELIVYLLNLNKRKEREYFDILAVYQFCFQSVLIHEICILGVLSSYHLMFDHKGSNSQGNLYKVTTSI